MKNREKYKRNVGSMCPTCRKGTLETVSSLGGEPMILECSHCKNTFYKNAGGELEERGTQKMVDEIKEYERKKREGKE